MRGAPSVCRLAWRPSRWECGGVLLLGTCAVLGVLASGVPWPWAVVLANVAGLLAVTQAHRGRRRGVRRLVFADSATLDGVPLDTCDVTWRGPLAFLRVRDADGRTHRLAWWPDTLPRRRRRALRRAIDALAPH